MKELTLALCFVFAMTSMVRADPGEIFTSIDNFTPPIMWDNVGGRDGHVGQTFLAVDANIIGIHVHIGNIPGLRALGPLTGPADLVLLDASNTSTPVELARYGFVRPGAELQGEFDFLFPAAIPIVPGNRYFIGIDAMDLFGLSMPSVTTSTYSGGAEAFYYDGSLHLAGSGRDLNFRILSREPGIIDTSFARPPLCRAANFSSGRCQDTNPGIDTFPVTAVLDHIGDYYSPDGFVKAFRTDIGCASPPCVPQANFGANLSPSGYRQDCAGTPISFSGVLVYVGASSPGSIGTCSGGLTGATSYLNYDGHSGYDFETSYGDVILAAAAGILDAPVHFDSVLAANASNFNALRIRHFNGAETWYLHAIAGSQCTAAGLCNPGQSVHVRDRQPIGFAGNTGLGCGACTAGSCPCDHLHFEIRAADEPSDSIDPFGCAASVASGDPDRCANSRLWLTGVLFQDGFETGNTDGWN